MSACFLRVVCSVQVFITHDWSERRGNSGHCPLPTGHVPAERFGCHLEHVPHPSSSPITWTFLHPFPCLASEQRGGQLEGFSISQKYSLSTMQEEWKQRPLKHSSSEIADRQPHTSSGHLCLEPAAAATFPLSRAFWFAMLPTGLLPHRACKRLHS